MMQLARRGAPPDAEARDTSGHPGPANGSDIVLDVRHLSVDYAGASGAVHAVDDVSFTLARGQILGLAGESGSGKSTLAYAIARLLRPPAEVVQGQVFYHPRPGDAAGGDDGSPDPVNVLNLTPNELRAFRWRQLAIVFQSAMNALNPVMNIGAQITDVLRAHHPAMSAKSQQERAAELLRMVGIAPDRMRGYPHELSGGMRQRATIAIALALDPEIIIMDEPTTALDVVVQREILAEITSLRERLGFSVIFITHDLSLLLEIADHVAIMYAGRIAEMATSADLRAQPRHPYSYGLLNSFPTLQGPRIKLTGIPGTPPDLRALPTGCAFHPRCKFAFEACRTHAPALRPFPRPGGSLVACHLYDEQMHPPAVPVELSAPPTEATSEPACPPPPGETL